MDPLLKDQSSDEVLRITGRGKSFLLETAKWAKLLAILGFIAEGYTVFDVLKEGLVGPGFSGYNALKGLLAIIELLFALIYLFPILYLFRASMALKYGILNNDEHAVTKGLENIKSHFRFLGISTIVLLALYALLLLFEFIAII